MSVVDGKGSIALVFFAVLFFPAQTVGALRNIVPVVKLLCFSFEQINPLSMQ